MFAWQPPKEKKSTCFNCPKVQSHGFDRHLKCCTYHPKIPNYQLGDALMNGGDSQKNVERMIAGRFLTPEGSGHTPLQWLDVLQQDQAAEYGRSSKTICGFLDRDSGRCGVYGFRNSACTTYFCRHDQKWSEGFWEYVHHFIGRSELALTQYALKSIDFDYEKYLQIFNELSSRPPNELCEASSKCWKKDVYQALWSDWFGREAELFQKCSRLIRDHYDEIFNIVLEEQLNDPNLMEVSAMEARYSDSEDLPAPIEGVVERLETFYRRIRKKEGSGLADS